MERQVRYLWMAHFLMWSSLIFRELRGPILHHDAGDRRDRHQGGTARQGRRHASLRPPEHRGRSRLLFRAEPQQVEYHAGFQPARGQTAVARSYSGRDGAGRELPPRHAGEAGTRLRRVRTLNPGLIYCSISGYGQNGPYSDRAGYDFVAQADLASWPSRAR